MLIKSFDIKSKHLLALLALALTTSPASSYAQNTQVKIGSDENYRYIAANGLPNYALDKFPNQDSPYTPAAQSYAFRMPLKPTGDTKATPVPPNMFFGVALNGVPFDSTPEAFWEDNPAWAFEPLSPAVMAGTDNQNGDVLESGAYVYRGIPQSLVEKNFAHIGYAADGFPIFVSKDKRYKSSYVLKKGERDRAAGQAPYGPYNGRFAADYTFDKGAGNLDPCNGAVVNNEYYIYVLTEEFPYIPRCWRGTPDNSFQKIFVTSNGATTNIPKANNTSNKAGRSRGEVQRRAVPTEAEQ